MRSLYKILTIACLVLFTVQCEVIDTDLLDSPNAVAPENVDPNFLLVNIQTNMQKIYSGSDDIDQDGAAIIGAEMTRMMYMFGDTYGNAYNSQDFNGIYLDAYADLFVDVKNLLNIAQERNLYFHAGMAKVLKAYAMLTLVDIFGDVPYSQALDPTNFNPALDDGESVYNAAIAMLDAAITDLQNEDRATFPATDLYYPDEEDDDKVDAWVRVANTLKLKAYLNTGNATEVNNLIASADLIDDPDESFTFEFSTNSSNPDSRHPLFIDNYLNSATDYMAVSYLNMMLNDKSAPDPRMRYYFYRQTTSDPVDVNLNTCLAASKPSHFQASDPFCTLGDGWWGRDHLIDDGIPPDDLLRTTFGVYPAGGAYDGSQGEAVDPDLGFQGAGFEPMLMHFYTYFMIAEAEWTMNNDDAAARTALETAVFESLEYVRDYGDALAAGEAGEMTDGSRDSYVATVLDRWDNNTGMPSSDTPDEYKTRNIAKEYYFALWPNGLEAYNLMRRTGYPDREDNLQPARSPNPGNWYRTFSYPANMVERNSSVSAKPNTLVRTFWDDRGADDEYNF